MSTKVIILGLILVTAGADFDGMEEIRDGMNSERIDPDPPAGRECHSPVGPHS